MTLNELIAWCNEHGVTGDAQLAVHAFGGIGGAGQLIERVSLGFDWDKGKLMLHSKHALTLKPPPSKKTKPPAKKRSRGRKPGPPAWPLLEQPPTTALLLPKLEVKETGEAGIPRPHQKGRQDG